MLVYIFPKYDLFVCFRWGCTSPTFSVLIPILITGLNFSLWGKDWESCSLAWCLWWCLIQLVVCCVLERYGHPMKHLQILQIAIELFGIASVKYLQTAHPLFFGPFSVSQQNDKVYLCTADILCSTCVISLNRSAILSLIPDPATWVTIRPRSDNSIGSVHPQFHVCVFMTETGLRFV